MRLPTFLSDSSGLRPMWPKMICFQPCWRPKLSVSAIDCRRMSPSPTLGPGLASTSPRTSTGVPLGTLLSDDSRGIACR